MDIWSWVHEEQERLIDEGHQRLAELTWRVSSSVCDGAYALAESQIEEALSLARALDHKWLEVFLRHWRLQSRILHRSEAKGNLPECVSLLDFANRPETAGCPQSVCATQDLVHCYGILDGPGYSDERIAASREALDRIDPAWPCFSCISGEYAGALTDAGRPEEAIEFVTTQRARAAAMQGASPPDLERSAADAYHALGRHAEMLREVEAWDPSRQGDSGALEKEVLLAVALLHMGDTERGLELLPPFERMDIYPKIYDLWADASVTSVLKGAREAPPELPGELQAAVRHLERNGAAWDAARVQLLAFELALSMRRPGRARLLATGCERLFDRLKVPDALRARLESLRPELDALSLPPLEAQSEDELFESLPEEVDALLDMAQAAHARWPESYEIEALSIWTAFSAGAQEDAIALGWSFLDAADPPPPAVAQTLGRVLLRAEKLEEVDRLIARLPSDDPQTLWVSARRLKLSGDLDAAARELERLLEQRPDAANPRMLLAEIERERGRFDRALGHYDALIEGGAEGDVDWDRMVAATIAGDWARVRDSARRLGFEFEGDGPIDEQFENCLIRLQGERGDVDCFAHRTGPVTATIREIAPPSAPQHYATRVVFDAAPLGDPLENDLRHYRAVHVLEGGGHRSFSIEGLHPGDEMLREFAARIEHPLRIRSGEDYEVVPLDGRGAVRGLYAFLAVPEDTDLRVLHERLAAATRECDLELAWPTILDELGESELAAEHAERLEQLDIDPD